MTERRTHVRKVMRGVCVATWQRQRQGPTTPTAARVCVLKSHRSLECFPFAARYSMSSGACASDKMTGVFFDTAETPIVSRRERLSWILRASLPVFTRSRNLSTPLILPTRSCPIVAIAFRAAFVLSANLRHRQKYGRVTVASRRAVHGRSPTVGAVSGMSAFFDVNCHFSRGLATDGLGFVALAGFFAGLGATGRVSVRTGGRLSGPGMDFTWNFGNVDVRYLY